MTSSSPQCFVLFTCEQNVISSERNLVNGLRLFSFSINGAKQENFDRFIKNNFDTQDWKYLDLMDEGEREEFRGSLGDSVTITGNVPVPAQVLPYLFQCGISLLQERCSPNSTRRILPSVSSG